MFNKFILDFPTNIFNGLLESVQFEPIVGGRVGTVITDPQDGNIPIVRTTTIYEKPAQKFQPIHREIIDKIKSFNPAIRFNNALVEIYDSSYRTMGYHSDQALDLAEDSYIGIFSCYDNLDNIRTLKIKNKTTGECSNMTMDQNSVILFSYNMNSEHLHKIILEKPKDDSKWFGITFRLSKTFVHFINKIPTISSGPFRLATEDEKREFYKFRSAENRSLQYTYPQIDYTISPSDLLPID